MPQVPNYRGDQVRTNPITGVKRTAAGSPESFGAGFGETVARVGLQIAQQAEQRAVQTQTLQAERELMEGERGLVDDPEHGVLRTRGLAAMEAYEPTMAAYDRLGANVRERVRNPRAREGVDQLIARRRAAVADRVGEHGSRELERHDQREHEAMMTALVGEGIAYANEPERLEQTRERLTVAVHEAAERFGLGAEATAALLLERRTALHAGVIDRLLAEGRDGAAERYLQRVREENEIAGGALPELERKVEVSSTEGAALEAADHVWQQRAPKTDEDPIDLAAMEQDARALLKDHPKILAATVRQLRERRAATEVSRQGSQDAIGSALWRAVAEGRSLEEIRQLPAYLNASGKLQAEISEHVVQKLEKQADRSYGLGQRAKSQREEEAQRRGAALYWQLRKPEALAALTEDAIVARSGELGSELAERLLRAKREGASGASSATRDAVIDREVLDQVIRRSGLTFTDAEHGDLLVAVEDAIDRAQQAGGNKKLNRDDARAIAQGVVDDRIMVNTWGRDEARVRATIVDAADREQAYVPLAQIGPKSRGEWANLIRSRVPRVAREQWTDERILQTYTRNIERAHAAARLGLSADEQLRRLVGQ